MKHVACILILAVSASAQVADKANAQYKTKEGRDGVAKTLDNPNRDKNQKPEEIIALMGVKPGMTVADIGTGTGYMLPFLSRAVGPNGKVFAEDIADDFLVKAKAKATADKMPNIQFFLGDERNPKLPAASLDIALTLDVYHHFDYPAQMLANISAALKPGGHYVIVDFYKKDRADHVRLERDEVVKEVESNGFHLIATQDRTGNNQYMITFEKR